MAEEEFEDREPRHPIRVVARRTGISLHVLRAWERRYGVVVPARTDGGQRLYSNADIARLKLLREAVEAGRAISQVADVPDDELAALVAQDRTGAVAGPAERVGAGIAPGGAAAAAVSACVEAAERLDLETLHRVLLRSVVSLLPRDFIEQVVAPLLHEVGERWHRGELQPAHEHAVSVVVGRVLSFLLSAYEPEPGAPTVVTTTVAGEVHEFGAMLASVLAAEAGWRVVYLGPSLPAAEIARAAATSAAVVVAVSVVNDFTEAELGAELSVLRAALRRDVRLLVGGHGAARHRDALVRVGGLEVGDLALLRETLPMAGEVQP